MYTQQRHNPLQQSATRCNTPQCIRCKLARSSARVDRAYCNTVQHSATQCNSLQHTATRCNALQHTATHTCRKLAGSSARANRDGASIHHLCVLQCVAACCSVLQRVAVCCSVRSEPIAIEPQSTTYVCCSESQCVAVCCSVLKYVAMCAIRANRDGGLINNPHLLQCVAACCSVLQCCSELQCVAMCCSVLQCAAVCCSVLQCVAVCCSVLLCVAVCYSVL